MQLTILASILTLATSAFAITVVDPANNATWDFSKSNDITWTSVSTDPTTIQIVLVEGGMSPPLTQVLSANTSVSIDSFTVSPSSLCKLNITDGSQYQVNLENAQGAIVAQSQQFTVTGSSALASVCSASTSSTSATASATSSSATSKQTNGAGVVAMAQGLGVVILGAAAFAML